jgi:transcriptional regulator with XRE-family HTH domain
MPAIIAFLGYDPIPASTALAERIREYRRRHGLSINEAAHRAGVHEDSWGHWERTGAIPWERYRALLDEFLASDGAALMGFAAATDDIVP